MLVENLAIARGKRTTAAMLVEDLAIARGKRTTVRFRIHAATDRWGGSSVTSMSSGHGAQRSNGGQIGEGPGI